MRGGKEEEGRGRLKGEERVINKSAESPSLYKSLDKSQLGGGGALGGWAVHCLLPNSFSALKSNLRGRL